MAVSGDTMVNSRNGPYSVKLRASDEDRAFKAREISFPIEEAM